MIDNGRNFTKEVTKKKGKACSRKEVKRLPKMIMEGYVSNTKIRAHP
jgi:hypothetical protein